MQTDKGNLMKEAGHPLAEYSQRIGARETESRRLNRRQVWIGYARLLLFAGIVALGWRIEKTGATAVVWIYWLAPPVAAFFALGAWHQKTVQAKNRANRAAGFYQRGVARIEDRWAGSGEKGEEFQSPEHLYAEDLDILGDGSLFQLLCVARTRMGKQRLASWLLAPANPEEAATRQEAAKELAAKLDFREDLATCGHDESIQADGLVLARWAGGDQALNYRRWWGWILALAGLSLPAIYYGFRGRWTPFILLIFFNSIVSLSLRGRMAQVFSGLDEACKNLDALAGLLRRMEEENLESPRTRALQAGLSTGGIRASECIAKLAKLAELVDSRKNMFVAVIDLPLLYSVQLGFALQRWKNQYGFGIENWLDSVAEIEALVSLAAYKFEHPQDPFPDFIPGEPCFDGEGLGHPLLAARGSVRNDLRLAGRGQVLLVSGSNMSGKSTLLRVVGVNAVLAMAGAPVRARALRISPLAVAAAMRISDSLQKGVSHFYAEISRIRQVVELSTKGSVLFLMDEILQGTNSHDRRVGAEGIVRALIVNGAIGLVTTHDLALTALADAFPGRVRNIHFQEMLEAGKLHFDYHLREGIVTTSNGIELMKSIGLDV